jgi:uncharacterized phage protein (TIGR01671 family)
MKREIKFRAWDGKRMTTSGIMFNTSLGIVETPTGAQMKLMQFTGLLDKNGKEIYESDIVKTGTDKLMVISWSEKHASFVIDRDGWAFVHYFGEAFDSNMCEVVGNIYENSNLL